MANSRSIRALCALLLMAAGCYADRNVGVSKGDEPDDPARAEPVKPKFPSVIVGQAGEALMVSRPTVGDMDGDGLDDFVLMAIKLPENEEVAPNRQALYLFYGRPEFPPQLSTADADAVFATEIELSGAVGDVNGDGLGDLQLMRMNSVEFVFGRKQRYRGAIAPETAGTVWRAGELPPPFAPGFATQFFVMPAGDLDGDGCADLLVNATVLLAPDGDGFGGGIGMRSFLVRGHRGEWESAVWDPNWASTGFGFDAKMIGTGSEQSLLYPQAVGDLDGDGLSDLLASGRDGSWVFYGKSDYPRELTPDEADARLRASADGSNTPLDPVPSFYDVKPSDLDGDGMSDIPMVNANTSAFQVIYGERWSGEKALDPDLTLLLEDQTLQQVQDYAIGDIDGDLFPDLMLSVTLLGAWPDPTNGGLRALPGLYLIRGTGERLTGTRQLTRDYRWTPPSQTAAGSEVDPGTLYYLKLAGDIDGDGSQDILTTIMDLSGEEAAVYFVPSTPKSPD